MIKKKCKLKISLIFKKYGEKVSYHRSPRKTQNFLKNKAESYLKSDYSCTIRVSYGKAVNAWGEEVVFQNSGTYSRINDLLWAYQVFVKEYL